MLPLLLLVLGAPDPEPLTLNPGVYHAKWGDMKWGTMTLGRNGSYCHHVNNKGPETSSHFEGMHKWNSAGQVLFIREVYGFYNPKTTLFMNGFHFTYTGTERGEHLFHGPCILRLIPYKEPRRR